MRRGIGKAPFAALAPSQQSKIIHGAHDQLFDAPTELTRHDGRIGRVGGASATTPGMAHKPGTEGASGMIDALN